mgnify:CR=1 FL=1
MNKRKFFILVMAFVLPAIIASGQTGTPATCGPVPSLNQLRWQQMEYYAFIHFSVNTYTDMSWGLGNEDPKKPLSDSALADMLGAEGIQVARRTVAKYREALRIAPANLRKAL